MEFRLRRTGRQGRPAARVAGVGKELADWSV